MTGPTVAVFGGGISIVSDNKGANCRRPVSDMTIRINQRAQIMNIQVLTLANFAKRVPNSFFHTQAGAAAANSYIPTNQRTFLTHKILPPDDGARHLFDELPTIC